MKIFNFYEFFINFQIFKISLIFVRKFIPMHSRPNIDLDEKISRGPHKQLLYASWRNAKGIDCKMIGPETKCLCDHRYKEHNHEIDPIRTHCKQKKCTCPQFFYVPTYASYDFKCLCKHSYKFHDPISHRCTKGNCGGCNKGFNSAWMCACGARFNEHTTIFESTVQRKEVGREVDDMTRMMGELDVKDLQQNAEEEDEREYEYEKKVVDLKKKGKLYELNNKIEKVGGYPEEGERYQDNEEEEDEIKAYELYKTTHSYIRFNVKI